MTEHQKTEKQVKAFIKYTYEVRGAIDQVEAWKTRYQMRALVGLYVGGHTMINPGPRLYNLMVSARGKAAAQELIMATEHLAATMRLVFPIPWMRETAWTIAMSVVMKRIDADAIVDVEAALWQLLESR